METEFPPRIKQLVADEIVGQALFYSAVDVPQSFLLCTPYYGVHPEDLKFWVGPLGVDGIDDAR